MKYTITITLLLLIAVTGCKTKQHATTTTDMNKVPVGTSTTTTTRTTRTGKASKAEREANSTTHRTAPIPAQPPTYAKTAHAVIYKTKADYAKYVPITLTDDGSAVASYPAPGDLYYRGTIATPTPLTDGFLLDNRGITPHSAFIKMTYEEYAKLTEVPPLAELYKMVIDKAPFTEMYDLGERNDYTDAIGSINTIIQTGKLKNYKKLK